jgi:hypothetical protein
MKPQHMTRILDGKRYDTAKAELVASDAYWDGHNFERHGRNRWLWRTPKGAYFLTTQTQWQGEQDSLEPLTEDEAIELYEQSLTEHAMNHAEAFPSVIVEDA